MIPMRHSWIFRSRWMALLWAAGIIYFAVDVATPDEPTAVTGAATDVTGATITDEQARQMAEIANAL